MIQNIVAGAFVATALLILPVIAQEVAEPEDYKLDHYRSPVPGTLAGGTVVDDETAFKLWKSGTVAFVDVVPRPPKPANLPEGTIWREKKRHSIPGSIWVPNVGYGEIAEQTHDYFKAGLVKVTDGDMTHPILLFCLADCWMSWNAAKRALEYGYTTVYWYPEGTDGWTFFDYPTEVLQREPEPVQN